MKRLLQICIFLTMTSLGYLAIVITLFVTKGDHTEIYHRLNKGGNGEFNFWGLLSPFQSEAQSIGCDTLRFTHRVIYPVAPHFELVEPEYSPEAKVAEEIKKVILDSLHRIEYDLSLDYDGQALAVRQYANPETIKPAKTYVTVALFGTASPEAVRYGLSESLIPGNYEDENDLLAKERLLRTRHILEKELPQSNVDFDLYFKSLTSKELQLENKDQISKAIADPSILNSMRYVDADISIITQKVKITTATAPIALPLWIALLSFLLWKIYRWIADAPRRRYSGQYIHTRPKRKFDLWWLILILAALLIYFAFLLLFPVWVILIMMLAYLIYAIYTIYHYANFGMFWIGFITTILQIIDAIVRFIRWIRDGIVSIWNWWKGICGCCRFFIILSFILLLLWVTGVMHVTFVWPF